MDYSLNYSFDITFLVFRVLQSTNTPNKNDRASQSEQPTKRIIGIKYKRIKLPKIVNCKISGEFYFYLYYLSSFLSPFHNFTHCNNLLSLMALIFIDFTLYTKYINSILIVHFSCTYVNLKSTNRDSTIIIIIKYY